MGVCVGDRLLIAKRKATVRYVGAVDGHEGTWVGVEWDDSTRGKHDGSVDGKKYFTCQSDSPTAGSFVRISKVSSGTSLVDALILRYTNKLAEGQATGDGQVYLHTSSSRKVWVELVGEDKVTERQSKTELLLSARLVGANVSHVGPPGSLATAAPNLQQLDLTDNLLGNWATVSNICCELPQLKALVLSQNKLSLANTWPAEAVAAAVVADTAVVEAQAAGTAAADTVAVPAPVGQPLQQLPGLQCLVLNQCGVTWQQVGVLQACLPNLLELHVGANSISSLHVDLPQQQQHAENNQQQQQDASGCGVCPGLVGFLSLQVLGLEDNCLADWAEVLRLAGLPNLKRLHLSGNPLAHVTYPQQQLLPPSALLDPQPPVAAIAHPPQQQQQQQQRKPFACLEALLLGSCQLASWADVDQLNCFPALAELRLSGNPLFDAEGAAGAAGGRRFEVIGRVAGLTLLNGADVKPRERRDCELRYLQNIAAEAAEQQQQQHTQQQVQQQLMQQHPRLPELQAKYGQVSAVAAKPAQQGTSLRSTTVELLLKNAAKGSTAKKKLPRTITVSALKLLTGRLFKLSPDQQQLLLHMPGSTGNSGSEAGSEQLQQQGEDISQDDTKSLGYWDVEDGCVIEVVHIDPQQQREQQEAAQLSRQQEHEQRMAQQLQQGEVLRSAADR